MNSITKIIAFSFAFLLSLNLATAQQGESKEKHMKNSESRAEKQTQRMTEKLSLTDTQIKQVAAINLTFAEKMKAAKEANTEKGEGREAFKSIRNEHHAAIKTVLTPEQVAKFDTDLANKKGKGRHGKKGHRRGEGKSAEERAAHHTERLTEKLSLSEEQTVKVAAINLDFAKKAAAIRAANEDREAGKKAIKILRTEQKAAIKTTLTPEQITQFEAMKDGKRGHKGKRGKGGKKGDRRGEGKSAEERAAHHTKRLTEKLSLNEEQAAKIAAINLDFAKKAAATKAANEDRAAGKEAIKTLRTQQKAAIKTTLTPEQITQFEAMKDGKKCRKCKQGKGDQ